MAEDVTSHRTFTSYIDRTRRFYAAQGYPQPYEWARFDDVPFTRLRKPLSESRIVLITTTRPWPEGEAALDAAHLQFGPREVWSGRVNDPPQRLFTDHLSWDKDNTHTRDVESFLPIKRIQEFVSQGRLGSMAARFHGVPTLYSQRKTRERDAPEILKRCREDEVDIALLVPL